ncbi:thioredoxin [bacterium]|nr:thioredoxin [bacterium]
MSDHRENSVKSVPVVGSGPNSTRPPGRLVTVMLLLTIAILFGLIRLSTWQAARLQEAISMVEARRYRDALPVLVKLDRFSYSKNDHLDYLLGLCQEKTGRRDLAIVNWNDLTPGTRFFDEATLRVAEWYEDDGKLYDAETRYRKALEAEGPMRTEIRHALMQLLWMEGRLEEARPLIRRNLVENERKHGPNDSRTVAVLRAHMTLDLEVYPVEHVRKRIEAAAARSPEDRGVALGRAYLAMRTGQSEEARTILANLAETNTGDEAVAFAQFLEAIDRGDWKAVDETRKRFAPDLPQPSLSARAAALVAAGRGGKQQAIQILETCLEANPGEFTVIDRLAEAYVDAGNREKAAALRSKRLNLDHDRREYANRVGVDLKAEASTMADLAERLGRYFEAAAFVRMMLGKAPADAKLLDRARRLRARDEATRQNAKYWEMADSVSAPSSEVEPSPRNSTEPDRTASPPVPVFQDIALSAGVDFVFESGRSPRKQLPETMSGGVALLDFDGDERLDIFVVQGGAFPFDPSAGTDLPGDRLYRNLGDGKFEDVTARVGLPARRVGYGHGAAVGDVDNDGYPDLFVSRYGSYALYRNVGGKKFEDATAAWGLAGERDWPSSAAFADLDNDGDLDLYVCHYVVWDAANPRHCATETGGPPAYCVPHLLTARPDHLFRNDGGRFVDISAEAGITEADTEGRGLGVVAADFDEDGLVDLYVANDGTADFMFRNLGGMKFEEIGVQAGVAANSDGGYQAGMGVGFGDFDADGRFDVSVTNFYGESTSLFQNLGGMVFRERGAGIGLKDATRYRLGFGTVMADTNNDGLMDIFTANGHVNDVRPVIPYEMPSQLLLGTRSGRIYDASARGGADIGVLRLGRGLAVGDLDIDGRQDLVQLSLDSPLAVFRNQGAGKQDSERFVGFRLIGTKSNRDGVGARVTVRSGEFIRHGYRNGGGSYQSANSPRLHFGLGQVPRLDEVVVRWPSGQVDRHANLEAGRYYLLKEGATAAEPIVVPPTAEAAASEKPSGDSGR